MSYIPNPEELINAFSAQEDYLGASDDAEKAIDAIRAEAWDELLSLIDDSGEMQDFAKERFPNAYRKETP